MANENKKVGILLINMGTPDAPTREKVGVYLKEFLMDPYVIDIPFPFRWFLVNVLVLPRRSAASAALYQKVWAEHGSPLLYYSRQFEEKLKEALPKNYVIELGMRYGNPSIPSALGKLKEAGVSSVIAFPLYPQYSIAATKSSVAWLLKSAAKLGFDVPIKTLPAFYDDKGYLDAVAAVSAPYLAQKPYDVALFSFHGLPEHQVKKTDPTGQHCLKSEDCCERIVEANRDCYRAQCFATAKALCERLGIPKERYRVSFQSRLGGTPWIQPFSDEFYRTLAKQGIRRIAVLCPSFIVDCLETVEEVSLRGRDEFLQNGGEELFLVPSVNSHEAWVKAVVDIIQRAT